MKNNNLGVMGEDQRQSAIELHSAFLEALKRTDFDDFQNEMNDVDTGRLKRFLTENQREERGSHRGGGKASATAAARLQILLASNPAYARQYNSTFENLRGAENATDRAIAKAIARLEKTQQQLQETLDRAAMLPDGTRVFRDGAGKVWTEKGDAVSDERAASIHWRGDEPAYEQFLRERESVDDRVTTLEALQGYRVDALGRIRDRMMDEDNPPSGEDLERFKREIEEKMPPEVHAERQVSLEATPRNDDQPAVIPVRTL